MPAPLLRRLSAQLISNNGRTYDDIKHNDEISIVRLNKLFKLTKKEAKAVFKIQRGGPTSKRQLGAQIYGSHHRIWLGTFKTEDLAGAAYDSAAVKLRHSNSADSHRNFPLNNFTIHEPAFQEHYSTEQILNMIKDGSYQTKFMEFLSMLRLTGSNVNVVDNTGGNKHGCVSKELFRKELTPSDVGKLNRLVIPKRYALKFFSPDVLGDAGGELELTFFDSSRKSWKFRYCYWQSSSSFVFTRGWNGFVKDKELKAKDVVVFYELSDDVNGGEVARKGYSIDVVRFDASEVNDKVLSRKRESEDEVGNDDVVEVKKGRLEENVVNKGKGIRLFGKDIIPGSL